MGTDIPWGVPAGFRDFPVSFPVMSVRKHNSVRKPSVPVINDLLRCEAAPAILKHSKSSDLLRKSLLSHIWRVPSLKVLSRKREQLF